MYFLEDSHRPAIQLAPEISRNIKYGPPSVTACWARHGELNVGLRICIGHSDFDGIHYLRGQLAGQHRFAAASRTRHAALEQQHSSSRRILDFSSGIEVE